MSEAQDKIDAGNSTLEGYIERCRSLLDAPIATEQECTELCQEIMTVYGKKIDGLNLAYYDSAHIRYRYDENSVKSALGVLLERRDTLEREMRLAELKSVTITNSSNSFAMAESSAEATIDLAISQIWSLPESGLSQEERAELSQMLAELKAAGSEEPKKVWKIARKLGDYAIDKAIDAIPIVMPALVSALRSSFGM